MWVFMHDAMFSAVEDRSDPKLVVVRARFRGDLEAAFGRGTNVIESEDGDYRFRIFTDKETLKRALSSYVDGCLNYDNFKNSIPNREKWRHDVYTKVWGVLYNLQEKLYPRKYDNWYLNYRMQPYGSPGGMKKNISPSLGPKGHGKKEKLG